MIFFVLMDFHWSMFHSREKAEIVLVTNNIGQRKVKSAEDFFREQNADVMLFQEAWRRSAGFSREYPDRFVANQGQFVIVSKYEIKNSGFVSNVWDDRNGPIAAWFELDFKGKPLVIYNVHMPTPRADVEMLRGKGFIYELKRGGGLFSKDVRKQYNDAIDLRLKLARNLIAQLKQETRPFLVGGDFNMPSSAYIVGLFSDEFTDVFARKGRGYGFTFPGSSWNPLSLFGPWLRIDYIFSGPTWQPTDCVIEPRAPAQHLAVAAGFKSKN